MKPSNNRLDSTVVAVGRGLNSNLVRVLHNTTKIGHDLFDLTSCAELECDYDKRAVFIEISEIRATVALVSLLSRQEVWRIFNQVKEYMS